MAVDPHGSDLKRYLAADQDGSTALVAEDGQAWDAEAVLQATDAR